MNNNYLKTTTTNNQSNEKESLANELLTIKAKFQKKLKVKKIPSSSNNDNMDDSAFDFKKSSYSELEKYCVTLVNDFLNNDIDEDSLSHKKERLLEFINKYNKVYITKGIYDMDCNEELTAKLFLAAKTYFSIDYKPSELNGDQLTLNIDAVFYLLHLNLLRAQYLREAENFEGATIVLEEVMPIINFVNQYKDTLLPTLQEATLKYSDPEDYWNDFYRKNQSVYYSCKAQADKTQESHLSSAENYSKWLSCDYFTLNNLLAYSNINDKELWDRFLSKHEILQEGIEQLILFIEQSTKIQVTREKERINKVIDDLQWVKKQATLCMAALEGMGAKANKEETPCAQTRNELSFEIDFLFLSIEQRLGNSTLEIRKNFSEATPLERIAIYKQEIDNEISQLATIASDKKNRNYNLNLLTLTNSSLDKFIKSADAFNALLLEWEKLSKKKKKTIKIHLSDIKTLFNEISSIQQKIGSNNKKLIQNSTYKNNKMVISNIAKKLGDIEKNIKDPKNITQESGINPYDIEAIMKHYGLEEQHKPKNKKTKKNKKPTSSSSSKKRNHKSNTNNTKEKDNIEKNEQQIKTNKRQKPSISILKKSSISSNRKNKKNKTQTKEDKKLKDQSQKTNNNIVSNSDKPEGDLRKIPVYDSKKKSSFFRKAKKKIDTAKKITSNLSRQGINHYSQHIMHHIPNSFFYSSQNRLSRQSYLTLQDIQQREQINVKHQEFNSLLQSIDDVLSNLSPNNLSQESDIAKNMINTWLIQAHNLCVDIYYLSTTLPEYISVNQTYQLMSQELAKRHIQLANIHIHQQNYISNSENINAHFKELIDILEFRTSTILDQVEQCRLGIEDRDLEHYEYFHCATLKAIDNAKLALVCIQSELEEHPYVISTENWVNKVRKQIELETTIKQAQKSLKELEPPYLSLKEDQSSSCNNNNN